MRRKQIVHNDKVDLSATGELDSVQSIESAQQSMRIVLDKLVVFFEDGTQELVLRVTDRLDDESIIPRKIEKRAGFTRRTQL